MNISIVGKWSLSVTITLKLCLLTVFKQNNNSGRHCGNHRPYIDTVYNQHNLDRG
jgi:hypothetical protein